MKKKIRFSLGDLQEISRKLADSAHVWVPQMFPLGKRNGRDWRVGDIDGSKGMSTSIRLFGEKAGCFIDHAQSDIVGGGPIELIRLTYNLSFASAVEKALDIARIPMPKQAEAVKTEREIEERDRSRVMQIYSKGRPLKGTLAQRYLQGRGLITTDTQDLLSHPQLPHWPEKTNLPAMLGVVRDVKGEITGIHRTYLDGITEKKANIIPNKMMLGNVHGGAVRLYPARQKVGIAEGIETAMAAHRLFNIPVWAALSSAGMLNIQLPESIKEVIICVDNDEPGIRAGNSLMERLTCMSIVVSIATPKQSGWDFNDQLLSEGK